MGILIDITDILKIKKFRHTQTKMQLEICRLVARTGDYNGKSKEVKELTEKRDKFVAEHRPTTQSSAKPKIISG